MKLQNDAQIFNTFMFPFRHFSLLTKIDVTVASHHRMILFLWTDLNFFEKMYSSDTLFYSFLVNSPISFSRQNDACPYKISCKNSFDNKVLNTLRPILTRNFIFYILMVFTSVLRV